MTGSRPNTHANMNGTSINEPTKLYHQ